MAQESLTIGVTRVFSPLLTFIGFLAFMTGAVIVSFLVYVMMVQRVKDIGLMKAAGCPNNLVFGYFFTELLMIVFVSCILGAIFGVAADYSVTILFSSFGFGVLQKPVNFGVVLIVFGAFFGLALVFGVKPILDVVKVEPVKAMSPLYRFGVGVEGGFQVVSRSGFTTKIALRSLFRRKSGTIRIVLCLSAVFILLTVAVAGAVIAEETTERWITGAIGEDLVL
jgi:putative ABC transport system permease protein